MFPEEIHTPRLRLEALTSEAISPLELYRYVSEHNDTVEEEFEFLPVKPHETVKDTKDYIEEREARAEDAEQATYVIWTGEAMESPGTFVGTVALGIDWEKRTGEQGQWMRKQFWGEGLLTEYSIKMHVLALVDLDLEVMVGRAAEGHDRAKRRYDHLAEKYGGNYEGYLRNDMVLGDEVRDAHRYTITREQFVEALDPDPITTDSPHAECV